MRYINATSSAVFLLLAGLGGLYAQEAVVSTGGDATGTGGSSSYTIGEVLYTNNTGTNGSIEQGVQQAYEISTITVIEVSEINLKLVAYPNPTTNVLSLNVGNYNNEKLSYQLYDMQGELLDDKPVIMNSTAIDMQALPMSVYVLNVLYNNSLIKVFRIIKN